MRDQIFLKNLQLLARIGVYAHEKQAPQPITLDITLSIDCARAAQTDHLSDTLDYAQLAAQLAEDCLAHHVELVETLAERLAQRCLEDARVQVVTLSLGKPDAISHCDSVGVRITRQQHSGS